MTSRNVTCEVFGQTIRLDGSSFGGLREIYGRQVYFSVPGFSLRPTDIVIDLGANAGVFTILAGRLVHKVIAVEAQSGLIREINSNIRNNNCTDKVCVEFGLVGSGSGVFSSAKRLEQASHFGEKPPVISMPSLITKYDLERIDFLKVDIEGSEFDLFNNDLSWLSRVEKVAMEVHLKFGDITELTATLQSKGFDVWLVDNDGNTVERIGRYASGYLFAQRMPWAAALF